MMQNFVKVIDRSIDEQEKDKEFISKMQQETRNNGDIYSDYGLPGVTSNKGFSLGMQRPNMSGKNVKRDVYGRYKGNGFVSFGTSDIEVLGKSN
jgi:hypothetical protein